jgi:hypothetical protein
MKGEGSVLASRGPHRHRSSLGAEARARRRPVRRRPAFAKAGEVRRSFSEGGSFGFAMQQVCPADARLSRVRNPDSDKVERRTKNEPKNEELENKDR